MLPAALADLAREEFVLLTTFRRDGRPVPTPVWIAEADGRLVISTPDGTGKLKRLRHTPRTTLQACSRSGKLVPGSTAVEATAHVSRDWQVRRAAEAALLGKYRWQWRVAVVVARLASRGRASPRPVIAID